MIGSGTLALAFVDPGCAPCRKLLPDLARRQRDAARGQLAIVISGADPDAVDDMLHDRDARLVQAHLTVRDREQLGGQSLVQH